MPTKKKQPAPAKKPAAKAGKTVSKKSPPAKPAAEPVKKTKSEPAASKAAATRDALRSRILGAKKKPAKPIAFSLDEVRAIAKTVSAKEAKAQAAKSAKPGIAAPAKKSDPHGKLVRPANPTHVKAASLADILGFNPRKARSAEVLEERDVPEKFKRYYKLLVDLRKHLTAGIELHSEETLKRSSKDDSGDLSAYGQHMADAGTDTFDRDFALSLVSSEQEALSEIDAAIKRVHDGTYGICEITQKPIAKERLLAVPFTRYSAGAQKELERNQHRARTQAGLFGELGEEGAKLEDDRGGGEE
ncbi:MAG TPA: TraR/DksA C4-type zinc finger protein [Opitutaceae bacterium]|nr:TraR/DksA C4-type zinc finger protein [Opitutaceae bacterium]